MLSNFGFPFNQVSHPGEEQEINHNSLIDFAKIFDEELFHNSTSNFGSSMDTYHQQHHHHEAPAPSTGFSAEDQLRAQLLSNLAGLEPAPIQTNYQQQQQQLPGQNQPLVNVLMIVDPTTQKVLCPKQVVQIEVDGKLEKTVFGPTYLDSLPKDSLTNFNQTLMQQQQQQQTTTFQPISPAFAAPPAQTAEAFASGKVSPSSSDSSVASKNAELPPLRALSAYNFFFRDERDRILNDCEHEWTQEKQMRLLAQHWNQDRTKKRRHRKTHGKIDFTTLSKLISARWKELPDGRKEFYRQVAAQDWERYQREITEYKKQAPLTGSFQPVIG